MPDGSWDELLKSIRSDNPTQNNASNNKSPRFETVPIQESDQSLQFPTSTVTFERIIEISEKKKPK